MLKRLDPIFRLFTRIKKSVKHMLRDKPVQTFVLLMLFIIAHFIGIVKLLMYSAEIGLFIYAWIALMTIMSAILALIIAYRTRIKEPVAPLDPNNEDDRKYIK